MLSSSRATAVPESRRGHRRPNVQHPDRAARRRVAAAGDGGGPRGMSVVSRREVGTYGIVEGANDDFLSYPES
jgi:hypothetical protein